MSVSIASEFLDGARRSAGLTQRNLAERTGVAQPTIARIEAGRQIPGVDLLDRLLRACGWQLDMTVERGTGVDRSLIEDCLAVSPPERLGRATAYGQLVQRLRAATPVDDSH
jgi:transcriptional regulator with XRE-family HTH domain